MTMARIAIAGTGSMARAHASAIQAIPDATIVAVYGRDRRRTTAFAEEVGAAAYCNLDELLDTVPCDLVDCCLATPAHHDAVLVAAAHGRHVMVEKPLASGIADARAMIAACRTAGVHLMVAQVQRFEPEFLALGDALAAGNIGTAVSATFVRQGSFPQGRDDWYADAAGSGGVFVDLMIHDFDWALSRFGPVESVFAKLVERQGQDRFAQGMAVVRHRGGVLSLMTATWGYPGQPTVAVELAGTGGLLRYRSDETQALVVKRDARAAPASGVPLPEMMLTSDPYRREIAHFLDLIDGRATPLMRPEESLVALQVALAAAASAASGRPVQLEDLAA
jgi:UDP-N-acetylglucosamine 3-dehydrogenase